MTDEVKLITANTFIKSLKNNDWDVIRTILVGNATWTLPGVSILSGLASGEEAIIKRLQNLKSFGVNFELKYILIGLNGFTLSLHNTAKRENLILDEQVAIVFEIKDGNSYNGYLSLRRGRYKRFFY